MCVENRSREEEKIRVDFIWWLKRNIFDGYNQRFAFERLIWHSCTCEFERGDIGIKVQLKSYLKNNSDYMNLLGKNYLLKQENPPMLVISGCHNKIPYTQWFKQRKCIFSKNRRLKVRVHFRVCEFNSPTFFVFPPWHPQHWLQTEAGFPSRQETTIPRDMFLFTWDEGGVGVGVLPSLPEKFKTSLFSGLFGLDCLRPARPEPISRQQGT